ncbi:MAG: hypothetical protein ACOYN8_14050 [Pseudanabaena sp.]
MQFSQHISTESEHLSLADRIESFKAGFLGAIASVFAFFAIALLHHLLPKVLPKLHLVNSFEIDKPLVLLVKLGMIGFSGFLFAVTYRYIVRGDRNSHLKSGAILAFACIRSFGTIDHDLLTFIHLSLIQGALAIAILLLENITWLAIVQNILETAIQHQWITAFGSEKP